MTQWTWAPWTLTQIFLTGLDAGNEGRIGYAVAASGPYPNTLRGQDSAEMIRWHEHRACLWLHEDRRRK